MERYDYRASVAEDVREYITDNYTEEEIRARLEENLFDFAEALNDEMWTADSVTGNGSGSYTFSTWQAEENLCHNMDLLGEALAEFGSGVEYLAKGAEACDVTIRCYLLGESIANVLDDIAHEMFEVVG